MYTAGNMIKYYIYMCVCAHIYINMIFMTVTKKRTNAIIFSGKESFHHQNSTICLGSNMNKQGHLGLMVFSNIKQELQ